MANHGWCLLKQQDSHGDSDSPANTNDGWQNHQKQGIQSFRGSMALPTPPCQISILKSCGTVGLFGGFFNLSVCGGDAVTVAVHSECQECQSWPLSSSLLRVCLWWHRGTRCHLHLRPCAYWFLDKYNMPQAESPSAVMNIVWQQHPSAPRCDMLPWDWRGTGEQHKWVDANLLSKSNSYVFCQHLRNSKRLIY